LEDLPVSNKKEILFGPYLYFFYLFFYLSHMYEYRENILPPTFCNLPLLYGSLLLAAALVTLLARALIFLDFGLGLGLGLRASLSLGLRSTLISLGAIADRV
jgi:hypothetical protein